MINHKGVELRSLPEIKSAAVDYFYNLYKAPIGKKAEMGPVGFKMLNSQLSLWLEREVTSDEIKRCVWDCDGSKSPGPDGFNFKFYKLAWDFIAEDLFDLITEFFRTGSMPKGVNLSFITLVPKKKVTSEFKEYRPISLIHGIYKIIAKILSSRLKEVIGSLISDNQTAFIADRQIVDGFMVANEVVYDLKSSRRSGLIFKVDFQKAFDSVLWDYIDEVMTYMGFGIKWRGWISSCLSTGQVSVLVNGSPSPEFKVGRGIRQGDPLSPFLFNIAAEGLSVLFQRAANSNIFRGIDFGSNNFLSHLQYADDTLVFMPASLHALQSVKRVLRWFALCSGLHINFFKSSLIGINVDDSCLDEFAKSVFCRHDSLPCNYLGMPLGSNPRRISTWKPIIDKFRKKLTSWKGRMLSMAGRICLIKSVLNSLPLYFMSIFLMPKGVCRLLTSIQRKFLWSGTVKMRKICKVQWSVVVRDKDRGGLGIGSLIAKNKAMLFKWIWRLSLPGNELWKKMVITKFKPVFENGFPIFNRRLSCIWRDISSLMTSTDSVSSALANNCRFVVGNGYLTRFWSDAWINSSPLKVIYPRLYILSTKPNATIADMGNWEQGEWKWELAWRRQLFLFETEQVVSLLSSLESFRLKATTTDKKVWSFSTDGGYTVKTCSLLIDRIVNPGLRTFKASIWQKGVPPKVQSFLWLAVQNRLCTKDFLLCRNIIRFDQAFCIFCENEIETSNHLLLHCRPVWKLWMKFLDWWGISGCLPCCVDDLLHQWPNLVFGKFQRKAWSMLSCCVSWSIWLMRNKVIFNDGAATFEDSFSLILYRLSNWLKSVDKFFMATGTTLTMGPEGIIDWSNTKTRL
jgi:hypothetical protein